MLRLCGVYPGICLTTEEKARKSLNALIFWIRKKKTFWKLCWRNAILWQVAMLKSGKAIPFHKKLCPGCHNIPKSKEWIAAPETTGLHVFHIGKRTGYFVHWEPIFIGTHSDPLYDERLSWEGKSDKMTQVRAYHSSSDSTASFVLFLVSESVCRS